MATSKNFKKRRKSFAKKKSFQKKIIIIFCNLLDVEFSKNLLQRKRIPEFKEKSFVILFPRKEFSKRKGRKIFKIKIKKKTILKRKFQ